MAEPSPKTVLIGPAVETLFARSVESPWPQDILNDPDLVLHSELRQKLCTALDTLYKQLPDSRMDIAAAIEMRIVGADAVAELYRLLTEFLDIDPNHRRLVLYLPFELLPHAGWNPASNLLRTSAKLFVDSYMRSWRELLEETHVRANFDDGNILEPALAPNGQPRVSKAAHLIPQLMRKGLISPDEVTALKDSTSSDILKESIVEALSALEPVLKATAKKEPDHLTSLKGLPDAIAFDLKKLDMREALDRSRGMPGARVTWERSDREDALISNYATRIAEAFSRNSIVWEDLAKLLSHTNKVICLTAMRGVRLAVEALADTERERALGLCVKFGAHIRVDMPNVSDFSDELESLLAHWAHLGFVTEGDLQKFGFALPRLDAPFSGAGALASDLRTFDNVTSRIASDPELSRLFYPVAIFFGSRLKGYAKKNADLDAAVFVRPGVLESELGKVRRVLGELFTGRNIDGKVVQFWLEARKGSLHIRDLPDPDVLLGDSTWVHLLLGSVWLGEESAVRELYTRLLPGFLRSIDKMSDGRSIRTFWLDEMEREVLQYRLLHKGYGRFFPRRLGKVNQGSIGPNPESTFWDSGYRRLATKLFISRVFLPQLKTVI
ncbi:MAG: hypothetical protein HY455_03085 [Parcubacteria group bacterium]|nr:hypothetical protein [Parcubacteria group bacterium]